MMQKCDVNDCGYRDGPLFKVPINFKNEWEMALNMRLTHGSKICATHFNVKDIITTWEFVFGEFKYMLPLNNPILKAGTIPVKIFKLNKDINFAYNNVRHDHTYVKFKSTPDFHLCEIQHAKVEDEVMTFFKFISMNLSLVNNPSKWGSSININGAKKFLSYYKISLSGANHSHSIEKQLVISEDSKINYYLYGELVDMTNILSYELKTVDDLNKILSGFENLEVCDRFSNKEDFQKVISTFSPVQFKFS